MASLKKNQSKLQEGQTAADAAIKATGEETKKSKGKMKDPDEVIEAVMAKVRPSLRKIEKQLKEA